MTGMRVQLRNLAEGYTAAWCSQNAASGADFYSTDGSLTIDGERAVYHWTLQGMNTGPGGTGKHVRISGFEQWRIGSDGLIAESKGHFDSAEYQRQLEQGADE